MHWGCFIVKLFLCFYQAPITDVKWNSHAKETRELQHVTHVRIALNTKLTVRRCGEKRHLSCRITHILITVTCITPLNFSNTTKKLVVRFSEAPRCPNINKHTAVALTDVPSIVVHTTGGTERQRNDREENEWMRKSQRRFWQRAAGRDGTDRCSVGFPQKLAQAGRPRDREQRGERIDPVPRYILPCPGPV